MTQVVRSTGLENEEALMRGSAPRGQSRREHASTAGRLRYAERTAMRQPSSYGVLAINRQSASVRIKHTADNEDRKKATVLRTANGSGNPHNLHETGQVAFQKLRGSKAVAAHINRR